MDWQGRGINRVLTLVSVSACPRVLSVCSSMHASQSQWLSCGGKKKHNWRELQKSNDHFQQWRRGVSEHGEESKREEIKERMVCKPVYIDKSPQENQS